jgi:DNA-binding transcriptional LysR family regulator
MQSKRYRPRLSLDLLKGFEAAARHLSFTRAAEELSLTQSAVSREIKTLEGQLGQPLFRRINRGLQLTDAGERLHRAVGEALKLIDEAAGLLTSPPGETLAITADVPLASMWLVPRLPRFFRLHPDVDVRSIAANTRLDLDRERLDIAVRWYGPGSSAPGGEPLFDMEMFPVCSPALVTDHSRPLRSPEDLAHHTLLDLETIGTHGPWSDWKVWLEAMKLSNLQPAGMLHFSHYDQVIQAAIQGSGIAIGRNPHNVPHLRDGLLVAPLGSQGVLAWGTHFVIIAPRSIERPVVTEFVAWLRDEIRLDAEADGPKGAAPHRVVRRDTPVRR